MRPGGPDTAWAPRELLLAAAARAVLAAFREPLEQKRLSAPGTATLRLLETALEPYRSGPPAAVPAEARSDRGQSTSAPCRPALAYRPKRVAIGGGLCPATGGPDPPTDRSA